MVAFQIPIAESIEVLLRSDGRRIMLFRQPSAKKGPQRRRTLRDPQGEATSTAPTGGGCPPRRLDRIALGQQRMIYGFGANVVPIAPFQPLLCYANTVLFHATRNSSGGGPVYPALPVSRGFEMLIFQIQPVNFMHANKTIHPVGSDQRIGNHIFVIDYLAVSAVFSQRGACSQALVHVIDGSYCIPDKPESAA